MSRARTISIDSARRPESASGQSLHASDTDSLIAKPFSTEPAITSTSAPADANVTWSGDQYVAPSSGTAATVGYADGAAPLGRSSSILRNRLPQVSTLGLPSRASSIYSPVEGPNRGPRNIVLLLDGTGQEFSPHNSNIIKLMSVLKADEQQSLYYSSGLGTVLPISTGSWADVRKKTAKAIDLALAWNFDEFVCDAYKFLMDTHVDGDRVFLFGFSRGAYVARALAGMIQKVGLLPPRNHNQVKTAYRMYSDPRTARLGSGSVGEYHPAALYRRIFGISRAVAIEFLGAFDTVSSLGGIGLPRLPFAGGVKAVKFFRHALALDERRARFVPEYKHFDPTENELWRAVKACEERLIEVEQEAQAQQGGFQPKPENGSSAPAVPPANATPQAKRDAWSLGIQETPPTRASELFQEIGDSSPQLPSLDSGEEPAIIRKARADLEAARKRLEWHFPAYATTIKGRKLRRNIECWFMGSHSDVGGGVDLNSDASLSNIPFRWMLREAVDCGIRLSATGLAFLPSIPHMETLRLPFDHPAYLEAPSKATIDNLSLLNVYMHHQLLDVRVEQDHRAEIENITNRISQDELAKIVRLAAALDVCSGVPLSDDAMRPVQKSLRNVWWLIEVVPLKTRWYPRPGMEQGTEETDSVWKTSLGSPRQIVPGQRVHRSVLRRMRHDSRYVPKARVGDGFPAWCEARECPDHYIWQL